MEHYNDKPQLIVSRIRRCEASEYTAADFYPASNRDPEEMFGDLETFVAMVRDEPLRQLLESIVNDASIGQRLKTAPAAMKIHHAFRGGLLEHIVSLCNLAAALTAHYPRLNLDWLIAGAILHDLGKIETLELTGVRFAYTTRGQLIEHVTLGLEILERHVGRFPAFPLELKTDPATLHREPSRRPGQRRLAAADAAGGVRAFAPGSDGRAAGTGVPADRLGTGR